ncbi:acetoacetate-CoA ligase [Purpureocillium lilacinum]|uniref:Acetoacetate-CoA ligase n=1 Tax=Purpureocillium lilacinum TaxID=33203 RepID=A0A179GKN9_PURLI|nr:acetoacetate-CoA ligase [Purpureocillium lilacinum]OAQ77921.1 acetoacetate-CoA ligase [Purpureocillium lilacinum]
MAEMEKLVPTVQSYEAPKPIWEPCTPPEAIPMNQYRKHINEKFNVNLKNSQELQKWSITSPQEFWIDLWSYVGIVPELAPSTTRAYDPAIPIDKIPPFFQGSVINYAENVLNQPQLQGNAPALIGLREGQGLEGERWSWAELREQVRVIRSALKRSGIKEGDRVAALISTSVWSVAIFLATASLGAIYTSIASDLGADGCISRLQLVGAYFERFDYPCWAQHDWASFNPVTGGSQIHGRSDGVLNPQGIRFGSSEIYSITEAHPFTDIIDTTLCVGRRRDGIDNDESVFLFVSMREGFQFDGTLETSLREAIRAGLSARHVPRFIIPVLEIPVTVNGKKVETLIKQTISTGKIPQRISSTVANPRCLESFRRYYVLEEGSVRARL